MDRHLISRMRDGVAQLGALVEEWSSAPEVPEIDWSRMRALEFLEILRERTRLVERSRDSVCLMRIGCCWVCLFDWIGDGRSDEGGVRGNIEPGTDVFFAAALSESPSRGAAGGFSGMSGCTPSTASQWAVQLTPLGMVSFSSRKTQSNSISSSSTK